MIKYYVELVSRLPLRYAFKAFDTALGAPSRLLILVPVNSTNNKFLALFI